MNLRTMLNPIIGLVFLFPVATLAKGQAIWPPIELSPDANGVIKGPVYASAVYIPSEGEIIRVNISSSYNKFGPVTATLYIEDKATEYEHLPRRLLKAPLAIIEKRDERADADHAIRWYVTFDIAPEEAAKYQVGLYIDHTNELTDTGKLYVIKISSLIKHSPPTSQPASNKSVE